MPAQRGIDPGPTAVLVVAPASKVVAAAEPKPVLVGIAVVDMAAPAVKSVFVVSVVVEVEPVEVAKVDVKCQEVAADTAVAKKRSAALAEKHTVGSDSKRKPRDQKPVPAEVVRA